MHTVSLEAATFITPVRVQWEGLDTAESCLLGIGVHWLLPGRQGLDWQSAVEFAGKADKLMCHGAEQQQSTYQLRLRGVAQWLTVLGTPREASQ